MAKTNSVLKLEELVFDKIKFDRKGFKNSNQIKYALETLLSKDESEKLYRVSLILKGKKKDEYNIEIGISGFFSFNDNSFVDETEKDEIIEKNCIAILIPYLRSQLSMLTCQPGVECEYLPIINVNALYRADIAKPTSEQNE